MKKKDPKLVRSTKHFIKQHTNPGKLSQLNLLLADCRALLQAYIDKIWFSKLYNEHNVLTFSVNDCLFDLPQWVDYHILDEEDNQLYIELSARLKDCLCAQAKGIIKGTVGKIRNLQKKIEHCKLLNRPCPGLQAKLAKAIANRPIVASDISIEFNSKCVDFEKADGMFKMFVRLSRLGKYDPIIIPIQMHKRDFHWQKFLKEKVVDGYNECYPGLSTGIRLNDSCLQLRWQCKLPEKKTSGKTFGADSGIKNVLTLSDGRKTTSDIHNHSLDTITDKMARAKKGSKNFKQLQDHRNNHINWSLNKLDWSDLQSLNLEHIENFGYKQSMTRKTKAWSNTTIEQKIGRLSEENGFVVFHQRSAYKSKRCYACGWVQSSNRCKDKFRCKSCGYESHADLNGAKNNTVELPYLFASFRLGKYAGKGFFWNSDGVYDSQGQVVGSGHWATNVESRSESPDTK